MRRRQLSAVGPTACDLGTVSDVTTEVDLKELIESTNIAHVQREGMEELSGPLLTKKVHHAWEGSEAISGTLPTSTHLLRRFYGFLSRT